MCEVKCWLERSLKSCWLYCSQKLQIDFKDIVTEAGWDYISVYDGSNETAPLLALLSGDYSDQHSLPNFTTTRNNMYVRFQSDRILRFKGFIATYSSISPGFISLHFKCLNSQNMTRLIVYADFFWKQCFFAALRMPDSYAKVFNIAIIQGCWFTVSVILLAWGLRWCFSRVISILPGYVSMS